MPPSKDDARTPAAEPQTGAPSPRRAHEDALAPFDPGMGDARCAEWIADHTVACSPPLVPELRLHLATPECALWRARPADLDRIRLPEPFWAFAWPGGLALARFLLEAPTWVSGRRVLDVGSGSGLVALAAMAAGAAHAEAADIDPLAAVAARMNAGLNGLAVSASVRDPVGAQTDAEVVLVADTTYEPELARRVVAWLRELSGRGVRVLVADPGRGFLDALALRTIAEVWAPSDVYVGERHRVRVTIASV